MTGATYNQIAASLKEQEKKFMSSSPMRVNMQEALAQVYFPTVLSPFSPVSLLLSLALLWSPFNSIAFVLLWPPSSLVLGVVAHDGPRGATELH